MSEASKESVALELTKIYLSSYGVRTKEDLFNVYSQALGVVNGEAIEVAKKRISKENEIAANLK